MAEINVPAAVSGLIEATNNADSDRFVSLFTADARVVDGGRVFLGHEGAASWNTTDNVGVGMRFDLISCNETAPDLYDVTLRATSRRFNGVGTLRVTLREGLIASLVIA